MTAERWRQIEEVYHSALELPLPERSAFIASACKGDDELRSEIEDLLRREESPEYGLLELPVWESAKQHTAALAVGSRLGPYEIVEPIGSGGMGLVYRALDTRLGRSVAIKTSRGPFPDRFG